MLLSRWKGCGGWVKVPTLLPRGSSNESPTSAFNTRESRQKHQNAKCPEVFAHNLLLIGSLAPGHLFFINVMIWHFHGVCGCWCRRHCLEDYHGLRDRHPLGCKPPPLSPSSTSHIFCASLSHSPLPASLWVSAWDESKSIFCFMSTLFRQENFVIQHGACFENLYPFFNFKQSFQIFPLKKKTEPYTKECLRIFFKN